MSNQNAITPVNNQVEYRPKMDLCPETIKKYLCPTSNPTDSEMQLFMELCSHQKLNPFLREVYLIKYGTAPAQIVVGKEGFLKRANRDARYKGHAVHCSTGPEGLTATARVYKEGFQVPIEVEVDIHEYIQLKNGKPASLWASKPRTMLKKVALCQALREAFPDSLGGMYGAEEVQVELNETPIFIEVESHDTPTTTLLKKTVQTVQDLRQWPEILEKYLPHLEEHGLSKEELGALSLDRFEELRQAVFGG